MTTARRKDWSGGRVSAQGFTLVELMVALTGGLFLSIVVFTLARDGSRFYQREARVASATMANLIGFERLQADIARAGFLSSPNVQRDPFVCGDPDGAAPWPIELRRLSSIRIQAPAVTNATLDDNGIQPDSIVLAGSYASLDQFPIRTVVANPGNFVVFLQVNSGPMARLGYSGTANAAVGAALLGTVFGAGRGLRIVDSSGAQHFGEIAGVTGGPNPSITLAQNPALVFRGAGVGQCGLRGFETGALANVINFVQYDLRDLKGDANYASLYAQSEGAAADVPFEGDRVELVRVELNTAGAPIAGTQELIAEYAVDLQFGLTLVNSILAGTDPALTNLPPGDPEIANWAGDVTGLPLTQGPQLIRAVRVRFSTRSREADREANVVAGGNIAPGLYRVGLGASGAAPFARVRTVQAEVSLRNQMGALWQ